MMCLSFLTSKALLIVSCGFALKALFVDGYFFFFVHNKVKAGSPLSLLHSVYPLVVALCCVYLWRDPAIFCRILFLVLCRAGRPASLQRVGLAAEGSEADRGAPS